MILPLCMFYFTYSKIKLSKINFFCFEHTVPNIKTIPLFDMGVNVKVGILRFTHGFEKQSSLEKKECFEEGQFNITE